MNTAEQRAPGRGYVLVTGASSGIGEATVRALAAAGYRVFAGVRRAEDGERLARSASVEFVLLDVTQPTSVASAAAMLETKLGNGPGLRAVVNNAGTAITGPLAHVPIEDLRRQLDVNVVGPVAVVQAFLPLLRRARGRIINVGSTSAHIAGPFNGAYCASKFALEAVTRVLRLELREAGIGVASVDPGPVATPLWDKIAAREELLAQSLESSDPQCAAALRARRQKLETLRRSSTPPAEVAAAIVRAVGAARLRKRYPVGFDARLKLVLARTLPEEALERLRRASDASRSAAHDS